MLQFTDSIILDGEPRKTANGYVVINAKTARIGIQTYLGKEVGKPAMDRVSVYRPEEEVFSERALGSFTHKPVTDSHPKQMVTSQNWSKVARGMTGDSVARDGDFVRIPFTLMDQSVIDKVANGTKELSWGYLCKLDWTPGITPTGEKYDAVQRDITGNHLAVVPRGRAGSSCCIGDSWEVQDDPSPSTQPEGRLMPDINLRTVLVDGFSVSTTDHGAQAIEKLQTQLRDSVSSFNGLKATTDSLAVAHTKAIETKDGEIAGLKTNHTKALEAKDGEIAALKAKLEDTAALDAMVADRAAVVVIAKKLLGDSFDPKGKSNIDMKKAVVIKQMGDKACEGKSDEYIGAAFDTMSAMATTTTGAPGNALRDALSNIKPPVKVGDASSAHAEYLKGLEDGWKTPMGGNA